MKSLNPSYLALSIAVVFTQAAAGSEQSESGGFFGGDTLKFTNRNMYFNRDLRHGEGNILRADGTYAHGYREEWADGMTLDYNSGFTEGLIGFGVDAHAFAALKLNGGRGTEGTNLLPYGEHGPETESTEAGGGLKMRISNTVVQYGNLYTDLNPVFDTTRNLRLLPETATGILVSSTEIQDLALQAGHFTALNRFNSTNSNDDIFFNYANARGVDSTDFAGGTYNINKQLYVSVFYGDAKDAWHRYYGNVNFTQPLTTNQSITFDLNVYRTVDSGKSIIGEINNTTYSLSGAYSIGAHTIGLGYQKVHGDTPFDYIGSDSIYLANSSQYSDFNGPNERSWQVRYELNMATLGIPGLTFLTRYVRGSDIDGTHADADGGYAGYYGADGKHWERDVEAKYVVQSGFARDLSIRIRQATHRANSDQGESNLDEVRVIMDYPWSIL